MINNGGRERGGDQHSLGISYMPANSQGIFHTLVHLVLSEMCKVALVLPLQMKQRVSVVWSGLHKITSPENHNSNLELLNSNPWTLFLLFRRGDVGVLHYKKVLFFLNTVKNDQNYNKPGTGQHPYC